jgi:hypothetical protein
MAFTYSKLAETTVASSASAITFNNIPQNYTDLVLKLSLRSDTTGTSRGLSFTLNNSASANYATRYVYGYSGGTASGSTSADTSMYSGLYGGTSYTASTFSNMEIYIPNYSGSTSKSVSIDSVMENNSTTNYVGFWAGLWSNVTAVSSIQLLGSTNFVQYSTATLYGIRVEL